MSQVEVGVLGPETAAHPATPGTDRLYAAFYRFACRVADGKASEREVEFMTHALEIADRRGDLNVGIEVGER